MICGIAPVGSRTAARGKDSQGGGLRKGSAATYSRASYTGTTIGNAVFDGRVRDGIGSSHCFMATVKFVKESTVLVGVR